MKPPPFDYVVARSIGDAIDALAAVGHGAKVLAGGQSLLPLLNMRLTRPALLVDVNRVPDLDSIRSNGSLELGALVRQSDALDSPDLAQAAPLLQLALRHVGHAATRSRGTVGGSVAHADPAAELPAALLALDADVIAVGPRGERTIPVAELLLGPFTTSLAPDELLTTIRVPLQGKRGFGFEELTRRHGDFALAGAVVVLDPARIVLFGVGGVPLRAPEAEQALDEQRDPAEAVELAIRGLEPVSDVHADSGYRRRVAAVLVRRAVAQAEARRA